MARLVVLVKTLTFAINPKPHRRVPYSCRGLTCRKGEFGFTLIELLVVLAIGALLVGVVPVAFNKMHDGSQYRETVRAMVMDLRQAHQLAVSQGMAKVFYIDLSKRQYGIEGQSYKSLPATLEVKTIVGNLNSTEAGNDVAKFIFLPEGGSTGGSIEIVRSSGSGSRIQVDWLLGQITQEQRLP